MNIFYTLTSDHLFEINKLEPPLKINSSTTIFWFGYYYFDDWKNNEKCS